MATRNTTTMTNEEMTMLAQVLGIGIEGLDAAVKTAKKKTLKTQQEAGLSVSDIIQLNLDANIASMKLSKRVFRGAEWDLDETGFIRDLVNSYYTIQGNRIKVSNQKSALDRVSKSNAIMDYFTNQLKASEENIQTFLDAWTDAHPIGVWLKAQYGIGPVIAAGIIAYFDVTKTKTAGGFWKYVGWDGESKPRKKGEKLSYNPKARVLVWKAGHSFRMGYKKESCFYGQLYAAKKAEYIERNESGGFAENAKTALASKKFDSSGPAFKTYSEGKLTDAHIDAMALRFASKMFMSHVFDVMYMYEYGELPPVPYVKQHLGHVHIDHAQHLDVIKPYLEERWPDRDWNMLLVTYSR